ncbi:LPXTG cell wall anchor domain-containing protein [Enterococcus innesii]|uniref:LPXTG cell wall anchor domain-containing protein n=1 Tax=Enterococcus innesii TaxID=2839759 RepID=UPI0022B9BD0C|nr:LPXTG cell wall anchor domain-containing protein [Enterococcus innesii]
MIKTKKGWLGIALLMMVCSVSVASALEVQQVETKGSIGFTGVYEPIGSPDPTPPESIETPPITDIAKPGGSLPQTNDRSSSWLMWLGILILSIVFFQWKKTKKQIEN